jgi:GNAT superfamily N-acetyltransferase
MGKVLQMVAREEIVAPGAVSGPAKGIVEITLSRSPLVQAGLVASMAKLFDAWAEEEGREPEIDQYVDAMLVDVRTGATFLIVACIDNEPVGMLQIWISLNAANGCTRLQGDRLYVLPEHRRQGVFRCLYDAGEALCKLTGAEEHVVSCGHGSWLQKVYESVGFEPTDVVLRRFV